MVVFNGISGYVYAGFGLALSIESSVVVEEELVVLALSDEDFLLDVGSDSEGAEGRIVVLIRD